MKIYLRTVGLFYVDDSIKSEKNITKKKTNIPHEYRNKSPSNTSKLNPAMYKKENNNTL